MDNFGRRASLMPQHRGFTHQRPARPNSLSRKSGQRQRDSLAQCLKHGQREEKRRLLGASPPPARGLRPPRIALRSSHPASPMMSRLRRHAFCWIRDRLNAAPLPRPQRQRHRRNWLSRKARRIGQRSSREGRGGGNVAAGAISGPLGVILSVRQGWRGRAPDAALRAS